MTVLTDAMRARLDALVAGDAVVLFMKGEPAAPQCGFSARVVGILEGLGTSFAHVDVLADLNLREAIKDYAQWPTFPQLWVHGELVGGCDIVEQMHEQGQLAPLVGAIAPEPPAITLTDAARDRIREVTEGRTVPLRLHVDPRFQYRFELVEQAAASDVTIQTNGVTLVLDAASARRADGMTMDYVDTPKGAGLVVDNPNEPARVQTLTVEDLAAWRAEGRPHHLVDVRTDQEWAIARIDGARLLDADGEAWLEALDRDAVLVFQCHHGVRSAHAAEHFLRQGFLDVYNLAGGIDAWSLRVDPSVPRY